MKKIILTLAILMSLSIMSCCTMSEEENIKKKKEMYFQDEYFVIIEKNLVDKAWIIKRVASETEDSLDCTELYSFNDGLNHTGSFRISDELWNKKDVGDTLYFEYILKERFFKIKNTKKPKKELPTPEEFNEKADKIIEEIEEEYGHTKIEEMTNLELERKLLDLERQMISIQDEMEQIKDRLREDEY